MKVLLIVPSIHLNVLLWKLLDLGEGPTSHAARRLLRDDLDPHYGEWTSCCFNGFLAAAQQLPLLWLCMGWSFLWLSYVQDSTTGMWAFNFTHLEGISGRKLSNRSTYLIFISPPFLVKNVISPVFQMSLHLTCPFESKTMLAIFLTLFLAIGQ